MRVKSLFVVNLGDIVKEVNFSVLQFKNEYGITSISDLTNLFTSRVMARMAEVYKKEHGSFIIFYLNVYDRENMLASKDVINYKRFLGTIEKKVGFPVFYSSLKYEIYVKMLGGDCPEYDEIIMMHRSFADCLPAMFEQIRKFKYHKLMRELIKDEIELFKCLSSL